MRLLFLACLSPKSGNCTTAERIRDHIESAGHVCLLRDTAEFSSASDVALLTRETPVEGALAIHLFKAGRLLLDAGVPFGVVFGGTDVNEDAKDEGKRAVMKDVLHRARFAVSFTQELKEKAQAVLECGSGQIYVQAQGVETRASPDFSWRGFLHSSGIHAPSLASHTICSESAKVPSAKVPSAKVPPAQVPPAKVLSAKVPSANVLPAKVLSTKVPSAKVPSAKVPSAKVPSAKVLRIEMPLVDAVVGLRVPPCTGVCVDRVEDLQVFLLVCGLRRVKDPLYLLNAFSEWHTQNPLVVLIIIGPKMDLAFSADVEECVERSAGVFLAADRSQQDLHAAMQKSCALVNTSLSEGMSAAILEAMDLGLPVLARDIPGNAAIVRHGLTGLLFSSPEDFVRLSKRLLSDVELQASLRRNGKRYVTQHHSAARERSTYQRLVDTLH